MGCRVRGEGIFTSFTEWVVNFPTKNFYVDLQTDRNLEDDVSPTLTDPDSYIYANDAVAPFQEEFDAYGYDSNYGWGNLGRSCDPFTMDLWDGDEAHHAFTSPTPDYPTELCQETNVVTFTGDFEKEGLQTANPVVIPHGSFPVMSELDRGDDVSKKALSGWARMDLTTPDNVQGLPVDGFLFTVYNRDVSGSKNYTAIHDHKYERNVIVEDAVID